MKIHPYSWLMVLILCSTLGYAQTIITDRPDQTESSSTIPKHSLQLEMGLSYAEMKMNNTTSEQWLLPSVLWRYGIGKSVELRLVTQLEVNRNSDLDFRAEGLSDLQLGTKIQILRDPEVNTEIAVLSHLIIPTAGSDITIDKLGTINKLSISHSLTDRLGIGYNMGYDYYGTGSGNGTYSIALGYAISDVIGVYAEPYGTLVEFDTHEANFDAGFTYLMQPNFQWDLSAGTGLNNDMFYVALGASINLDLKRDSAGD